MTAAHTAQGSRLTLSYEGIGEMLRSEWMEAEMRRRALRIRDICEETAPVYAGRRDTHRGRFKASFHVTSTRRGGRKNDRAAGIAYSDDPAAVSIEFGTLRTPAHHTMRNALVRYAGEAKG